VPFSDRLAEWSSRVHPDDLPQAMADVQRHLDGATPVYTNEHRCRCKDGSWKWILDRGLVIARDDTGKPVRMIGTHSDITTRKETEAALEASEARSRAIVEASPVPMALNDADQNILFVNPAFTQTFGYELADIPTLSDWWPKAYPDPVYRQWVAETWQRELARSSQAGTDFAPLDLRIRCKDGTDRIAMVGAAALHDTFAGTHLVVLHDITERKRAEEALRASRHHLEQAQVVGHIGSWISEPGPPARLAWSAETCRIFGVAPGAFDGRPETFTALVHPEDRARVARAVQAAQAGGPAYDLEHRIVRPDGQERWVHEQADFEHDPAGRTLRLVGVTQDITDRKHLEEQLRQAQKMEAIGQLAGGIAHDFNNILGSILGNAELVRLLPPGSPETGECLDDILTASRRAGDLVGQILAFSRRQESRRLPIQLQPVVREVLKLLRATVPAHVEFRAQLASVPPVLADPTELHSVIMNLCTNAWHALLGRRGLITVGLAEVEPDEDFIRRHPDLRPGRHVCLTVADDGCGMDEATLGRIFEPFFTTKPVGTGTGLGLSVVHGIVKNHDGAIVVQSRPGAGTTFQLYFPVFAAEAPGAAPPPQPVPRGAGEHILFVDDEEPLARMGTRALERLGYRVTPHTRPAAALAAFRARPTDFDLVVVDYNMPGLNGTEFGAQVLEVRPVQRIILTTGFSATLTPEAARDLGFRELMPKPYDLNRLGETVHRVLAGAPALP
jgi:PAS domain S-box-containing protein